MAAPRRKGKGTPMFDLVLKGGRVIDPAQNLDRVCDVAFADGRVAALGDSLTDARERRDVAGLIVTPGLIDLHTHVYWGGTSAGVDPDAYAKPCGITTSSTPAPPVRVTLPAS